MLTLGKTSVLLFFFHKMKYYLVVSSLINYQFYKYSLMTTEIFLISGCGYHRGDSHTDEEEAKKVEGNEGVRNMSQESSHCRCPYKSVYTACLAWNFLPSWAMWIICPWHIIFQLTCGRTENPLAAQNVTPVSLQKVILLVSQPPRSFLAAQSSFPVIW